MNKIQSFLISTIALLTVSNAQSQEISQGFKEKSYSNFSKIELTNQPVVETLPVVVPVTPKLNSYSAKYLPVAFTVYGLAALAIKPLKQVNYEFQEEILENRPTHGTRIDDYLQYYPAITTFAFKLAGKSGKSDFINSIRVFGVSTIVMAGAVYALKKTTGEWRPDGSNTSSFPSGHTATAFASAEIMRQEFKDSSPILSYSGYLAAATTGGLRMYNNKHYFSDVLAGAGIGILSTKAAYWLNKKIFASKVR